MTMMKNILPVIAALMVVYSICNAAPIVKKEKQEEKKEDDFDWQGKLNYEHYLTQVMNELEKDEDFAKRLSVIRKNKTVKAADLASQLTFAKHSVRTRLDELKRLELKRLAELERRLDILKAKRGDEDVPEEVKRMIDKRHIDHENPSSFEIDDLQRLIKRAVADLKVIDEKQKEDFKKHEMEKEILHKRKVKHIKDPKKKEEEEKKWQDSQARHNKHEKIHAPGSEDHLKEVWEKEDHMEPDQFNPRTFFQMHDLNGDGELEEDEIETLFQTELDKAYNPNDPDDDMQERYESMMEMRKDMMKKIDANGDMRISYKELVDWTKSPDFKKEQGYQLPEEDKSKIFSQDDLKKFEKEYDQEHPDEEDEDDDEFHDQDADDKHHVDAKASAHAEVPKKDRGRKVPPPKQSPDHL